MGVARGRAEYVFDLVIFGDGVFGSESFTLAMRFVITAVKVRESARWGGE